MRSLDMLVVGTSVEHDAAVRDRCSGVRVVVHRVGIQNVSTVVDLGLASELEHSTVFFLLQGADGDILLSDRRGSRWRRRLRFRRVGGKKQLAGYYGQRE